LANVKAISLQKCSEKPQAEGNSRLNLEGATLTNQCLYSHFCLIINGQQQIYLLIKWH